MEEIKVPRPHKKQRTEQEIIKLLNKYSRGDISAINFCKKHDIVEGTLYAWKKKYHHKINLSDKSIGFVPLTISEPEQSGNREECVLFAEVVVENGKSIKLFQQMPAAYLKELIS